jgi:hypothetical protein
MHPISRICLLSSATLLLLTTSAVAECAATEPHDVCLVGTWKMTVNGAEVWMRQNIHQAHVAAAGAVNNTITLKADGMFITGASRTNVHVVAEEGHMEGEGGMNAQASGRWLAAGGTLKLCPATTTSSGSVTVHDLSGFSTTVPTHITPRNSAMSYHCSGNTLTTTQPMPHNTTMTSTYVKIR